MRDIKTPFSYLSIEVKRVYSTVGGVVAVTTMGLWVPVLLPIKKEKLARKLNLESVYYLSLHICYLFIYYYFLNVTILLIRAYTVKKYSVRIHEKGKAGAQTRAVQPLTAHPNCANPTSAEEEESSHNG